jgi:hypothetical protein
LTFISSSGVSVIVLKLERASTFGQGFERSQSPKRSTFAHDCAKAWNIPIGKMLGRFVADSAEATGIKWAAASSCKIVQIVNATNGTQTITSSSTFADSNLSATITPTSSSNKILVFFSQNGCGKYNSNTTLQLRLLRGSTVILNCEAAGGNTSSTASNNFGSISATYLDSPATTSATTYKTQINSSANVGSAYVNDATSPGSNSTITLMEVTP